MSGYFLLENPNPNAPVRGNGKRGWYYTPPRRAPVRCVGVHTTESVMDTSGPDTGAEGVARYLSRVSRPASYHEIFDSDSVVLCLPWDHTAFGIRSFNSPTVHVSFATQAHTWGRDPEWDKQALRVGAKRVREIVGRFSIPLKWLTKAQAEAGERGFVRHSTMDPSRRSDPGDRFPAERFFELIENGEESDMPLTDEEWKKLGEIVEAKVRTVMDTAYKRKNTWGHDVFHHARVAATLSAETKAIAQAVADHLNEESEFTISEERIAVAVKKAIGEALLREPE